MDFEKAYEASENAYNLYDGGWRASDRDEIAEEYGIEDIDYLDAIVKVLEEIESYDLAKLVGLVVEEIESLTETDVDYDDVRQWIVALNENVESPYTDDIDADELRAVAMDYMNAHGLEVA